MAILTELTEEDIQHEIIRQETLSQLYTAIDSLPTDLREILTLSFHEGLQNAEIAERLGIALITVKKRKARMLKHLREQLPFDLYLYLFNVIGTSFVKVC